MVDVDSFGSAMENLYSGAFSTAFLDSNEEPGPSAEDGDIAASAPLVVVSSAPDRSQQLPRRPSQQQVPGLGSLAEDAAGEARAEEDSVGMDAPRALVSPPSQSWATTPPTFSISTTPSTVLGTFLGGQSQGSTPSGTPVVGAASSVTSSGPVAPVPQIVFEGTYAPAAAVLEVAASQSSTGGARSTAGPPGAAPGKPKKQLETLESWIGETPTTLSQGLLGRPSGASVNTRDTDMIPMGTGLTEVSLEPSPSSASVTSLKPKVASGVSQPNLAASSSGWSMGSLWSRITGGGEPQQQQQQQSAPSKRAKERAAQERRAEELIRDIYSRKNPAKLKEMERILEQYQGSSRIKFYRRVCEKYGEKPVDVTKPVASPKERLDVVTESQSSTSTVLV